MTHIPSAEPIAWARLWATAHPFARPMPRAGAWYPVVVETEGERFVLEVRGKRVAIKKRFLEIRPDRPTLFTVVVLPREATEPAQSPGPDVARIYVVCPACSMRVRVLENQAMASCSRCGHRGEIAWWETG